MFKEYGMDPERYYARNEKGEPQQHLGGAFSKEGKVFSSCPNNPNWMALKRDITLLFAENGFGGVFYDVGVLADDADMFCHCDYCKAKWKKHLSAEGLDPETPIPVAKTGRDMISGSEPRSSSVALRLHREDWMTVRNAVKAKYPKFVLGPNSSDKVTRQYGRCGAHGPSRECTTFWISKNGVTAPLRLVLPVPICWAARMEMESRF